MLPKFRVVGYGSEACTRPVLNHFLQLDPLKRIVLNKSVHDYLDFCFIIPTSLKIGREVGMIYPDFRSTRKSGSQLVQVILKTDGIKKR